MVKWVGQQQMAAAAAAAAVAVAAVGGVDVGLVHVHRTVQNIKSSARSCVVVKRMRSDKLSNQLMLCLVP